MFLLIHYWICFEIPLILISVKFPKMLCLPEAKLYFYSTELIYICLWSILTHPFCIFFLFSPPSFFPFFNPRVTGIMQK